MILKNGNLCIRDAKNEDCDQLALWWNDGKVMAHAGFPNGLFTSAEKIREQIADDSDNTRRRLIITLTDEPIGEMSYYVQEGNVAEIGIKICNTEHQEHGLGRQALSMLIRELFSRGFTKIILDTNVKNERAQHVYELLGFHKVRVRENSWRNQLGELQSSIDYELLPEEFIDRTEH